MTKILDDCEQAIIGFVIGGKNVRMVLNLPAMSEERFWKTPTGRKRKDRDSAFKAWEQECRRLWRSLSEVIKAKLVAVDDGISTVEREFLADIVMPDNRTISDHVIGKLNQAYQTGKSIPLLPSGN